MGVRKNNDDKFRRMTEPDVTLTDYALALLCTGFAWSFRGFPDRALGILWVIFFSSIAIASLAGGTVHGFFLDESTLGFRLLWPTTLIAIGVTAAAAWVLAGLLVSAARRLRPWIVFAVLGFVFYTGAVLFHSQKFALAIVDYLPAMIALLAATAWNYRKTRRPTVLWISAGIVVGFLAAYVQRAGIAIHPQHFNHNSTYHLIQAFGLGMMFRGAKGLSTPGRSPQ